MTNKTPEDSNPSGEGQLQKQPAAKSVRITREPISQHEIDDLNARHGRTVRQVSEIVKEAIEAGRILTSIKTRLGHGRWGKWVERNLHFTIRTATRYMKAYEKRYDPMLSVDPAEFMARIYGNEPKELADKTDVKKNQIGRTSEIDNTDEECYEEESKPASLSHEEWTGIQIVRELGKSLDAYLAQPIAERDKLMALLCAYDALVSRIEPQATKLGLSLDQALAMKRTA